MKKFSFIFLLLIVSIKIQAQIIKLQNITEDLISEEYNVLIQDKFINTPENKINLSKYNRNDIIKIESDYYNPVTFRKPKQDSIIILSYSEKLEEIVYTQNKTINLKKNTAEQIAVITAQGIAETNAQNTADLLDNVPGVRVQKSQMGGGSPNIRGFEANRVLLVIDGVRMNNAIYRMGHLQNALTIDPSALQRTEVLFGPSSVIYGSDALGGVVHFYTKEPLIDGKRHQTGDAYIRLGTANKEQAYHGNLSLSFRNWSSFTSITYSDFKDLRMGAKRVHGFHNWGKQPYYSNNSATYFNENSVENKDENIQKNTGYNQFDLFQKITNKIDDYNTFSINGQFSISSDIPRFDQLNNRNNENLKWAIWNYGPQKRLLISPKYNFTKSKYWYDKGTLTTAYQFIEESRIQQKFGSLKRRTRRENVHVASLNIDFNKKIKQKGKLNYGSEFTFNRVLSKAKGEILAVNGTEITGVQNTYITTTRYPDGGSNYSTAAIYSQYSHKVSPEWNYSTGLRFNTTYMDAKWNQQDIIELAKNNLYSFNHSLTGNLTTTYNPSKKTKISGILSSGFRSPNIDDMTKIREKSGIVTVPNVNLKPEYIYNTEFNINQYFFDKNLNINASFYYTYLDNYISRASLKNNGQFVFNDDELTLITNKNFKNAAIYGTSLFVHAKLAYQIHLKSGLTYTNSKTFDTNNSLPSIPPLFGSLELFYQSQKLRIGSSLLFNGRKKAKDYDAFGIDNLEEAPNPNYGTPSWYTLNFKGSYKFNKNFNLQIDFTNILDHHYRTFASGISAPGRNFTTTLRYHF